MSTTYTQLEINLPVTSSHWLTYIQTKVNINQALVDDQLIADWLVGWFLALVSSIEIAT